MAELTAAPVISFTWRGREGAAVAMLSAYQIPLCSSVSPVVNFLF
jgi:hypothetical protein